MAVLSLAVGIGATASIFIILNAVLLRPLPFPDSGNLVVLEPAGQSGGASSPGDFRDLREQAQSFSHVAAWKMSFKPKGVSGGEYTETLKCAMVSAAFIDTLGLQPLHGRGFSDEECQQGNDHVAILSHGLWKRSFAGDTAILGKTIGLDRRTYTVVGIMSPSFQYPKDIDVWIPLALDPSQAGDYNSASLLLIGRLKEGVTLAQGQSELAVLSQRLAPNYPAFRKGWRLTALSLHETLVGKTRPVLLMLLGAVAFLLLIACLNVANLLLARAIPRRQEIAVRLALGANRARLFRQFVTESALLSLIGGGVGLLLAIWSTNSAKALLPPDVLRVGEICTDWRVLSVTFGISLASTLFFGVAAGLQSNRADLTDVLKSSHRHSWGRASARAQSALVITEIALTTILLTGGGLLIKSLILLRGTPLGFDPDHMMTSFTDFTGSQYATSQQRTEFTEQVMQQLRVLPGVQAVSAVSSLPFSTGTSAGGIVIEGREEVAPRPGDIGPYAGFRWIASDYPSAIRMQLLKGRGLHEQDNGNSVVVINQVMARRYWPDEDPVGRRVRPRFTDRWFEVVGVVSDLRHFTYDRDPDPEMFFPLAQSSTPGVWLLVRTAGKPTGMAEAIRNAVRTMDKTLPVDNVRTMDQRLSDSVAEPRFRTLLLAAFALLA